MAIQAVMVVGAGPSGLLLAVLLGKKGMHVQILEAASQLDDRPRATHYSPPATYELRRAGILEKMKARGAFIPTGVCWRKLNGEYIAGIDAPGTNDPSEENPLICLSLDKLCALLKEELDQLPNVELLLGHTVADIGQDETKAWVDVRINDSASTVRFEAQYIVGCDGANSQTYYPFEKHGFDRDSNFIIDPEHWFMAARISNDGLWRVTYGELPGLTFDELKARQPEKFKKMLPGHPNPEEYKMINFSPYKVHQRLAKQMRVGRFLLAADAAHLCNPFGGLGLTGGIVDVGGLYDCLVGIFTGQADDSILDLYDSVRREKYKTFVDPVSSANIRLLFQQNPETALQENETMRFLKKAETDEETARLMKNATNTLMYDFTQHYKK